MDSETHNTNRTEHAMNANAHVAEYKKIAKFLVHMSASELNFELGEEATLRMSCGTVKVSTPWADTDGYYYRGHQIVFDDDSVYNKFRVFRHGNETLRDAKSAIDRHLNA